MHATSSHHILRSFISSPARCARRASPPARRSFSSQPPARRLAVSSSTLPVASAARASSLRPTHSVYRTIASTSSTRATHAQSIPGQRAELVAYPTPESLPQPEDEDEPDIDLIPPEEATLTITDRAAEKERASADGAARPEPALRIAVESGGCHGYQYKLQVDHNRAPDDYHFSHPHIKPSNVYVDAVSMSLLKGSTVDFATELIGSSFRVAENPQAKGSSCGCGVSWELKLD
ncbi:hypothetical protein BD413DRAFT_606301 [Trametes elegans]|nr:hypothetical protein BD413DRAFT_606301 [Trametes elegans]